MENLDPAKAKEGGLRTAQAAPEGVPEVPPPERLLRMLGGKWITAAVLQALYQKPEVVRRAPHGFLGNGPCRLLERVLAHFGPEGYEVSPHRCIFPSLISAQESTRIDFLVSHVPLNPASFCPLLGFDSRKVVKVCARLTKSGLRAVNQKCILGGDSETRTPEGSWTSRRAALAKLERAALPR
jgi:hypothetical protein